ncbi:PspC domain-containing protein [Ruania alba]|uniref:Phage shock protein PspC (Stress-responsive transcriptional regulator) n=1 Tax=Ruania alba TaxID=648782 RepID=A0A1H5CG12_9MICO|nr:PspC domain-containing protein [Ruania alba]SED65501.1 Phage shock protein PspC (stress-responsive transcriptional regulator) [Ruania alba]
MNSNAPDPEASAADGFFDSLRRTGLPRTSDRWIGGVAAGIAHRLGIDPLIVRGAFLLITLFGGFGLLVYGVAWALLPEQADGRIHLQEAFRGRFDAALAGAILLTVIGLSRAGFWWSGWGGLPVSLGVIALIALVVVIGVAIQQGRKDNGTGPSGTPCGDSPGSAGPGGPSGTQWTEESGGAGGPWSSGATPPPPPAGTPGPPGTTVAFAAGAAGTVPAPAGEPTAESEDATESEATSADTPSDAGDDPSAETPHPTDPTEPADPTDPADHETHVLPPPDDGTPMSTTSTASAAGQPPKDPPPGPPAGPQPPVVPQPPTPPPPPKPRVPGPGATLVRVTLGLILLVVAVVLFVGYTGVGSAWTGPWFGPSDLGPAWSIPLVAIGAAVVLFGLGSVVAGLMSRRSGSLGVLGTLVALVAVPWAMVHSADVVHRFDWNDSSAYNDEIWRPTTATEAQAGFDDLAGGSLEVDLTELDGATVPEPVTVEMGAGQVTVVVPDGMPITIEGSVTGEVTTRHLDDWTAVVDGRSAQIDDGDLNVGWRIGGGREVTLSSPESVDSEALELQVDLGFGEIVIEEQS